MRYWSFRRLSNIITNVTALQGTKPAWHIEKYAHGQEQHSNKKVLLVEIMKERRRHERQPTRERIKISILQRKGVPSLLPAEAIEVLVTDISEAGIGLHSEVALEPGQKIKLLGKKPGWNFSDTGVVMWTVEASDGCRAGIKFD